MKIKSLMTKNDFDKAVLNLQKNKTRLADLNKNSVKHRKLVKKIISETIYVEAHSLCLDTEGERRKLSNIIFKLYNEIGAFR